MGGKGDLGEFVKIIVIATRQYAKRQHVFWKRLKRILADAGWEERVHEVASSSALKDCIKRF